MDSRKKVTVLVPAYNEAGQLPALHAELRRMVAASGVAYGWEFLVVDDGSTDDTQAVLRQLRAEDPRLRYVTLSRNFGKENALMAGFDYATGDCVVMMDSDLQHPVDVIPAMLREWEAGYDDVYGRRLSRGREPFVRRRLTMAYYRLLQSSTRIDVLAEMGDFRLLDRRCVDAMRALRENSRYTKGLLGWIGYRKKGVDYTPDERYGGKSRFSYRKLVNLAAEGICGFSTSPLRATTLLGLAVALGAFVYILFVLCKTLIWGESVQGYPTLMCVILFLGGCQLTAIGIIGEYIGRIYNETKRRPPYIADNVNGEKV
jgi:glycosyltransferase, group 2 family